MDFADEIRAVEVGKEENVEIREQSCLKVVRTIVAILVGICRESGCIKIMLTF